MTGKYLKVTVTKSRIGRLPAQRKTLDAMGLTRTGRSRTFNDTPTIRGMIRKVEHLVEVEAISS